MTKLLETGIVLVAVLLLAGTASAYPRAVLFTFDDARGTVYTTGYPIFADHGYNATFYVVTDEINTDYYPGKSSINRSQLTTLYNAGWDIGDHTRHHDYAITDNLNLSTQIAEIQGGKDDLNAWGLTRASSHLAFPGGQYNDDTTTAMISAGMLTGRTVESTPALTVPPFNNDVFHLTGVRGLNNQTDEDEEYAYLESLSSDNVVIYLTHGVDDPSYGASTTTSEMLEHMLDYMEDHHIPVWTITQLYANISTPPAAPVANFTAAPRSGTGPLSVSFTDTSTNSPTSWKWAYKNATVGWTQFSTTKNPVFAFPAGTYDINLTVTNAIGPDSEVKTGYVSVTVAPPAASFVGIPVSGTAPLTVAFTDSSTGSSITNRRWDFGDGNISNYIAATNPSHRYVSAGTYTVNLTVTNAGGSSSLPRSNYITVSAFPAPVADFYATPLTGTGPLSVGFTDTSTNSPTSWRWAYKNATIGWTQFATIPNPSFIFAAGTYDINLTATNAGGSGTFTRSAYIHVSGAAAPFSVGVYRPSAHTYYLKKGTAQSWTTTVINWGASTDLPVTGDWNGDGTTDIGVYRPSAHTFYLKNGTALSWTTTVIDWGATTDLPVTGDWNGDGTTDIGVYRPSAHTFYLKNGTALSWTTTVIDWGAGADRPVTGRW